jgi:ribosomal protein L37AE/L43A
MEQPDSIPWCPKCYRNEKVHHYAGYAWHCDAPTCNLVFRGPFLETKGTPCFEDREEVLHGAE